MIEIKLPRQKVLRCQSTGKRKKIKFLKSGDLFMVKDNIYEKQAIGACNISDFDDIVEPDEDEYAEVYEEVKQ